MPLLPNLICPGAQKAGTSTLYQVLRQHPDITGIDIKEARFFDKFYDKGIDWYKGLYRDAAEGRYNMDFTPGYMTEEIYVQRISDTLGGGVKFIFMLRNPVDRMYSTYHMYRRVGLEPEADERKAFEKDYDGYRNGGGTTNYFRHGLYGGQIEFFLGRFPRENMMFVIFEEFIRDIRGTAEKIFEFLGLGIPDGVDYDLWVNKATKPESGKKARLVRKLTGLVPRALWSRLPAKKMVALRRGIIERFFRSGGEIEYTKDPVLCNEMMERFMPDIRKLEAIIGRDLLLWHGKYRES